MKLTTNDKKRLYSKYGPWALVTGASSGIGNELAKQLADAGFNLMIHGRQETQLAQLEKEIKDKHPCEVKIILADLAATEGIERVIQETHHIDIGLFIASAGFGTSGNFIDASLHLETTMLRVNCEALLFLTHHFAQRFSNNKKGGIILMSSMVAFQGVPFSANYAATKAYVQTLAEALEEELKPNQVDVLAAAPGPVNTRFAKRANMKMNMALEVDQIAVPILKALGKKTTVFPGMLTKILVYSLRTVPRWAKIKIMKLVMGGMTKHQLNP
jgi:uncharacterized protein